MAKIERETISEDAPAAPSIDPLTIDDVRRGDLRVADASIEELASLYKATDPKTQIDLRNTIRNVFILGRGYSDADFSKVIA